MIDESQSHKGRKRTNYGTKFKLEERSHAELPSNHSASFVVKRITEWRKEKDELKFLKQKTNGTKGKQLNGY